jgi:hypothetical protein
MAKRKERGPEYEHHIVGVRMRITGSGNMQLSLTDLDDIQTQNLVPIAMAAATRFEPLRLANFQSQRTRLVGKTSIINEHFEIGKILIFAKPVALEYPA